MWAVVLVLASVARGAAPTVGETGDTGAPPDPALDLDQDKDGFSPNQGDCDDTTKDVAPGLAEVCFDQLDNDCNGFFDDGCDDSVHLASLRGGGGCTGGGGIAGTQSVVLLVPLLGLRRRK